MNTPNTKVLIVDDELPIREELKTFPWEKYDCAYVGEATNGQEALDLCLKHSPDIVITDITMPVMDGLELINRLKVKLPETKVIILTCHKDFEYAKKAIESNAIDYILKLDLIEEEISKAIQKAKNQILKDKIISANQAISERLEILKYFTRLKNGDKFDEKNIREKLKQINFSTDLSNENYFIILERSSAFPTFFEIEIQRYLHGNPLINNWVLLDSGLYFIAFNDNKSKEAIEQFVSDMQMKIDNNPLFVSEGIHSYLIITDAINDLVKSTEIFEKETVWRGNCFYNPFQAIFYDKEMRPLNDVDSKHKEQFYSLFENKYIDIENIDVLFKDWAVSCFIWPNQLKDLVSKLILNEFKQSISQMPVERIWSAINIDELSSFVKYLYSNGKGEKYRYEIRKAIQIIKAEYASPISLSYVADGVNLSPQYLSKLFSEEVGESFNDFVTRIRMESAQRLILNTNLKVYQIAEEVGIPNYRYFSFLYKKWFGKSPKESKRSAIN